MKRLHPILILLCFLFSLSAFADEDLLKPQTQGDVTFVSGGIGENERHAIQAIKGEYNLNLLLPLKGQANLRLTSMFELPMQRATRLLKP